jgi:hypothetical protein
LRNCQGYNGLIEQAAEHGSARERIKMEMNFRQYGALSKNLKMQSVLARISQILKTYRQGVVPLTVRHTSGRRQWYAVLS